MINYIDIYFEKIKKGEIKACKKLHLLIDLIEKRKKKYKFDIELATRPIEFIETFCKHSKGKLIGKPFKLELFQKAWIQMIFGFINENGFRVHKEIFVLVARKNGKSALLSAIGLYMLIADGEGGAEIACVASKKDQAKIVFNEAKNMVFQNKLLKRHIKPRKSDLYAALTFSSFLPLSSDSNTLDGLNLHAGIIDELHSIKDRNIYDVTIQSMSARLQPLLLIITTNGFNRNGIFDEVYENSKKVLEGIIEDDKLLPLIYELNDIKEIDDSENWIMANPGIDTIKKKNVIAEYVKKGKETKGFMPTVITKEFNIPQNAAESWLAYEVILNETLLNKNIDDEFYCVGGVDLSATTDLTCATLMWLSNGKTYVKQHYWIPKELAEEKEKEDKVPYSIWNKKGLLSYSLDSKVNYSDVTNWFVKQRDEHGLLPLNIGYDSWSASYWKDEMEDNGFQMKKVIQGAKTFSSPMKFLEAELKDKNIIYDNNPILKWCLSNTRIETDVNDNIRPVKSRSQRQRIDGAVALIIAYVVYLEYKNELEVYEN